MDYLTCQLRVFIKQNRTVTPKTLMEFVEKTSTKQYCIGLINKCFLEVKDRNILLVFATELLHINLRMYSRACLVNDIDELLKNVSTIIDPRHPSVNSILELIRKLMQSASSEVCFECLICTLLKVYKSPYDIHKQLEGLFKSGAQCIYSKQNFVVFCVKMIDRSVLADVHCGLLSEVLKFVPNKVLMEYIKPLSVYVYQGFFSNVSSVQRSYLYRSLVERLDFACWEKTVFLVFKEFLEKQCLTECFMESVKNYFIPISATKYREDFYITVRQDINNVLLCVNSLLYLSRTGFPKLIYYKEDIFLYLESSDETVAVTGFEIFTYACNKIQTSEKVVQVLNFLYSYKWLDFLDKIENCMSRILTPELIESIFNFSVVMLHSNNRIYAEAGTKLLKVVCNGVKKDNLDLLLDVYMKNSGIRYNFINDLNDLSILNGTEITFIRERSMVYQNSKNISHLMKASHIHCVYLRHKLVHQKDITNDLKLMLTSIEDDLEDLGEETFKKGSFLFHIKCLRVLLEEEHIDNLDTFELISKTVNIIVKKHNNLDSVHMRKICEAVLSDSLTCMYLQLNNERLGKVIDACLLTIHASDWKQPVTTASVILQKALEKFGTYDDISMLIQRCLHDLKNGFNSKVSIIRRSAAFRLVLHSVSLADDTNRAVPEVMEGLLRLMNNGCLPENSIEAAFNSIETLLSDKQLRPYSQCYIEHTVEAVFNRKNVISFGVRNAVVQVWRTIMNILKGQSGVADSPLEKIFVVYQKLPYLFYGAMVQSQKVQVNENCLLTLTAFAECHKGIHLLIPNLNTVIKPFMPLFVHLILTESGFYGKSAIDAFVAQCPPDDILFVLCDIGDLILSRRSLRPSILINLIILIDALTVKYKAYFKEDDTLKLTLYVLVKCVSGLNLSGMQELLAVANINLALFNENVVQVNRGLPNSNGLPLFLENLGLVELNSFLQELDNSSPVGLHISILSIIVSKIRNVDDPSRLFTILNTLIIKTISLKKQCDYLMLSYAQTVYFIYETIDTIEANVFRVSSHLNSNLSDYSIYHSSIFALLLQHPTDIPSNLQKTIRRHIFSSYRSVLSMQDPETLSFFASTLPYLYSCAKTPTQKSDVLRLSVVFMWCGDADREFRWFVARVTGSEPATVAVSAEKILSYGWLMGELKCADLVLRFLVDVCAYVTHSRRESGNSFYSADADSDTLSLSFLKMVVMGSFRDCYRNKRF